MEIILRFLADFDVLSAGQEIASINDRMEIDEKNISVGNISFFFLINV